MSSYVKYCVMVLLIVSSMFKAAHASVEYSDLFNEKYSPLQRWEIERLNWNPELEKIKEPKLLYQCQVSNDFVLIMLRFVNEHNQFPSNLNEFYPELGFNVKLNKETKAMFKPPRLLNPHTKQLTKQVTLAKPQPGDVTIFNDTNPNNLIRNLTIVWNERLDQDEIHWLNLIQDNGTLISFIQPRPGEYGRLYSPLPNSNSVYTLRDCFRSIIYDQFNHYQPSIDKMNFTAEDTELRANAPEMLNTCGSIDYEETEAVVVNFHITLDAPEVKNPTLKAEERWKKLLTELQKQLPADEQTALKEKITHRYYFELETAFNYIYPQYRSQVATSKSNPLELFNSESTLGELSIKPELPKNPYTRKPLATTPLDKPYPGAVTYLSDKAATGKQRTMILVWNYRLDADDMKWLLLFENNGGLMNFCWSKTNDNWKLSPNLFTTLFPSVKSVHFYYD